MGNGGADRRAGTLVLLVGGNPVPNYLAAAMLEPERVVLVHTAETVRPKQRLAEVFGDWLDVAAVEDRFVEDPTRGTTIRLALGGLGRTATHLNYTGGTKSMAVHARAMLSGQLGDSRVSYLDGEKRLLRFDDGHDEPVPDGLLDFDVVRRLHGIEDPSRGRPPPPHAPSIADVVEMARSVLQRPELADGLYSTFHDAGTGKPYKRSDLQMAPFAPASLGLDLACNAVPGRGWTNSLFDAWRHFLCGTWLDQWAAELVQQCGFRDVQASRQLRKDDRALEVDVVAVRDNRVYALSCTTSSDKHLCKLKLFEVALRARQLGGDLARAALVCLLDGSQGGLTPADLERDGLPGWDAPNPPWASPDSSEGWLSGSSG